MQSSEASISSAEPRATVSADSAEAMSGVVQLAPKAGPIDRAILAEMMLFYLNLAVKAGRGWDGTVKPAPGQVKISSTCRLNTREAPGTPVDVHSHRVHRCSTYVSRCLVVTALERSIKLPDILTSRIPRPYLFGEELKLTYRSHDTLGRGVCT